MKKIVLGPRTKRVINASCFVLSLFLLLYNISIIGFFYLIITYGEVQGILFYSLLSVAGIFLVVIPLVFKMVKHRFYYFALIAMHLAASSLPIVMKNMTGVFERLL